MAKQGANLYSTSQAPTAAADATIAQGMLEGSNVEPVIEITHMIEVMRAYQATATLCQVPGRSHAPGDRQAWRDAELGDLDHARPFHRRHRHAAQQTNVGVIANNLANMNTTGFKQQRAEFQDLLYQNIQTPGAQTSDPGHLCPQRHPDRRRRAHRRDLSHHHPGRSQNHLQSL